MMTMIFLEDAPSLSASSLYQKFPQLDNEFCSSGVWLLENVIFDKCIAQIVANEKKPKSTYKIGVQSYMDSYDS